MDYDSKTILAVCLIVATGLALLVGAWTWGELHETDDTWTQQDQHELCAHRTSSYGPEIEKAVTEIMEMSNCYQRSNR
jgi:nucleoside-specific outer membrane channel protein Tsx